MKELHELEVRVTQQKGRWGYIVELGVDRQGKRQQKTSFRYDFKRDAKAAGDAWLKQYKKQNGLLDTEGDLLFLDYIDHFFEYYEDRPDIKPSTVMTRKSAIHHPKLHFEDLRISEITLKDHQKMIDSMIAQNYSDNYIMTTNITMKLIYAYAIDERLRYDNPSQTAVLDKPKIQADDEFKDKVPEFLELDELKEMLALTHEILDYRWYCTLYILSHTGMRLGEYLALKWSDIDFEERSVKIYKTMFWGKQRKDSYELLSTKTSSGYRKITLTEDCCRVLRIWRSKQDYERRHSARWLDENFVCTNMRYGGYPSKHTAVERQMRMVMAKMNLHKKITPHKLRHTHVSLLAQAGVPLPAIMERVGHGDSKITTRIYLHVTKNMMNTALSSYQMMLESSEKSSKIIPIDVAK